MRRGLVAIAGDAGPGLGRNLIAGSIFIGGQPGRMLGAGMKRGSIVLCNDAPPPSPNLLPTFAFAGHFRSTFLVLYSRRLAEKGIALPVSEDVFGGLWDRYNGDLATDGQGEILARSIVSGS
jgi:formylmethanofuran dehydrogenase subunit C